MDELEPRIHPLPEAAWTPRQAEVLAPLLVGPTRNIYTTLVRHPDAAERMTALGRELRGERLSLRHRELLILRTGWNCRSNYEFAQHRRVALAGGMTEADVDRVIGGPTSVGWDPFERTLCQAADELHHDSGLSDETWASLAAVYDEEQAIQAVLLVGYYHLVSQTLNALRVPLEPGAVGFEQ